MGSDDRIVFWLQGRMQKNAENSLIRQLLSPFGQRGMTQLLKFCDFIKFSIFIFCGTEKNEGGGETADQNLLVNSRTFQQIRYQYYVQKYKNSLQKNNNHERRWKVFFSALRISDEYYHKEFWGKSSYHFLYAEQGKGLNFCL